MRIEQSAEVFEERLSLSRRQVDKLSAPAGVDEMVSFYEEVRADDCFGEHSDALLFQWSHMGTGENRRFVVEISRQFECDNADEIYQLALSFNYPAYVEIENLGDGEEWCDKPQDAAEFISKIMKSKVMQNVRDLRPEEITLRYEEC
ncbi:MAG: hypothetical protein ACOCX1_03310 [Fimbriimonadaceae bacterium]